MFFFQKKLKHCQGEPLSGCVSGSLRSPGWSGGGKGDSPSNVQGQDGTLRACALQCPEALESQKFGRMKKKQVI